MLALRGQGLDDFAFARQAMADQTADLGVRVVDEVAVTGRDIIDGIVQHAFE